MTDRTPPLLSRRPPDWAERNWKWLVPAACLFAATATFGAFLGGRALLRSSVPFRESLVRAQADPGVAAALGTPITDGFWLAGQINLKNSDGSASLAIPISGPKGAATLHVVGEKHHGQWRYPQVLVRLHSEDKQFDLSDR